MRLLSTPAHAAARQTHAGGALGLLLAAALLAAPPAVADATDDAFLAALQQHGIVVPDPDAAISAAHGVCSNLDRGQSKTVLMLSLVKLTNLSGHEASYFIGSSVASYCPQHRSSVDSPAP